MRSLLFMWLLLGALSVHAETIGYDQIVIVTAAVSEYDGRADLPGAKRDVTLFHKAFDGPWDAPVQIVHLEDAEATGPNILKTLKQAAKELGKRKRSLLIFYFAGHGETGENGEGFIVPHGGTQDWTTWLEVDALRRASKRAEAVGHQLFILGSCFGGTLITRGPKQTKKRLQQTIARLTEAEQAAKWREEELAQVARVGLVAGNARQKVPDDGNFGRAIANALRWNGKKHGADYNNDGCVDRYELATYVHSHGKTAHNTPRMGPLPDDQSGVLALCKGRYAAAPRVVAYERFRGGDEPTPKPQVLSPGALVAMASTHRPALRYIPAGKFTMGSPRGEAGRDDDETQHEVKLPNAFLMMRTEVTQGQWKALMGTSPSYFSKCGADCPVEQVNWWEALAYANALSKKEGRTACYTLAGCDDQTRGNYMECTAAKWVDGCTGYRLPTEAEWEYAARAGTPTAVYTGGLTIKDGRAPELDPIAWYDDGKTFGTHPVAKKRANAWGLHDMLGNVWEWCWDWMGAYPEILQNSPRGAESGRGRVLRGGSGDSSAREVRAADRSWGLPGNLSSDLGFRLVRRP